MTLHTCDGQQGDWPNLGKCDLLSSAYILAGLAMMLNIRLSYSSAPYALIRFKLPENLFSVFVRRMASALELWCLPSMLLGNIMDTAQKFIVVDKIRVEAGKDSSGTLGQKAQELYQKAIELNTAVSNVSGNAEAAKVLKHKAGEEETPGKLRKLAADLYDKAKELAQAVKTGDDNAASTLAKIIGSSEGEEGLRKALNQLSTGQTNNIQGVKTNYDHVKNKFGLVQAKNTEGKYKGHEDKYQAVVKAWDAFNNVYNPEEQLKDAVGQDGTGLQGALKELAEAGILSPDVHKKAQAVRDKYNDVKGKFELVQKQISAYGAGNSFKSTNYTPLKGAWDAFNNAYREIIYPNKFYWIIVPSIVCQWLNFLTYVLLLIVYLMGGDQGHLTVFYFVIAISGVVFGINMTLVYAVDFYYIPVYIAGENCFPALTSFIHYLSTLIFGNRRKYNSDFIIVNIDILVAIIISLAAAVVWTIGYLCELSGGGVKDMKHIHAFGFGGNPDVNQLSPALMIVVGMGLVYAIYPGIAPGMIVPFYLIDKIEMVLLIATIFPPVIIAILRKYESTKEYSPQYYKWPRFQKWTEYGAGRFYLFLDVLMVIKICLAAVFIYSLHYRDSHISRSIINQPKMSTFLSITFYMCHEILLALGFSGFIGNDGGDLILIPQYIGALFMIFLAFYSEGYIIEYKSHDPAHWPTEGMTKWNAFCYWCKRASKITNHNLRSLFTTDLRRDLLLCIQKNELI